jgi:tripartite ATP-independent transporter DctP family solute receptor
MYKIHKSISLLSFLVILFMQGCGNFNSTPSITFSHILSDKSEWHVGAEKWKELVERELDDKISIRLITTASLSKHNQRTELEMVQAGTLGGSWESSILLTTIDPRWNVWSLPWMFDSYEQAAKVCDGKLGQEMLTYLEAKGIVGLAYGFNGFRQITNSKLAIANPKDLKNLKIRVPDIKMFISLFNLWEADPSQMNFGDLFVALQQKTMDAQENPLHVIRSSKIYELQPYLTIWNYTFDPIIFCLSKQVWDGFTPEYQKIIKWAAIEAAKYQRQTVVNNEKEHEKFLFDQEIEITTVPKNYTDKYRTTTRPLYDEYKKIIGEDLLRRFLLETENLS